MREIKFRAWDKDRKAMVFIDGVFNRTPSGVEDLSELMQYTGLKDKNGTEIYEGDIVESNTQLFSNWRKTPTGKYTTSRYIILWHEDSWATKEIYNDRWSKNWNNKGAINHRIGSLCSKFYSVIGNIFKDGDLLEGSNK